LTSNHQSTHPQTSDAVLFDSEQIACNSQQSSDDDRSNQVKTATVKLHSTCSLLIYTRSILQLSGLCPGLPGWSMSSWCHCHSLSLAPVNPDWFYLPGFTLLVSAHLGSPGHSPGAVEW